MEIPVQFLLDMNKLVSHGPRQRLTLQLRRSDVDIDRSSHKRKNLGKTRTTAATKTIKLGADRENNVRKREFPNFPHSIALRGDQNPRSERLTDGSRNEDKTEKKILLRLGIEPAPITITVSSLPRNSPKAGVE